jgi:hypothetical protein
VKIVVTGEADEEMAYAALDILHAITPVTMLIETGGPRAELWARFWAEENGVQVRTVRDDTPTRTSIEVFKERPKYVLAFPFYDLGLIRRAKTRGVQVGFAEIRQAVVKPGDCAAEVHAAQEGDDQEVWGGLGEE